jgi:hypothetical protein
MIGVFMEEALIHSFIKNDKIQKYTMIASIISSIGFFITICMFVIARNTISDNAIVVNMGAASILLVLLFAGVGIIVSVIALFKITGNKSTMCVHLIINTVFIFTVIFLLGASTNNSYEYRPNKTTPLNISREFYKETVKTLNMINKNMISNMDYTDGEIQNILRYFKGSTTGEDIEREVKWKIGFLQGDSIRYFEAIRTGDKISKEKLYNRYQIELKEIEILLNIKQ